MIDTITSIHNLFSMTEKEALDILKHHSFTHYEIDNLKSEKGYLGMLRPFRGELYEENFHELMSILKILKKYFSGENVERQIISNFWSICHLSRAWGLEEGGMLRRNNLISDKQIELLATWTDCISYAVMGLLEGLPEEVAFEPYSLYLDDKESENFSG